MNNEILFKSHLSKYMSLFIEEKHSLGYKYESEIYNLRYFDQYCFNNGNPDSLNQSCIERYLASNPNRSAKTKQNIIGILRQFAFFLIRNGCDAYVFPLEMMPKKQQLYKPYIFTHKEIQVLMDKADHITPNPQFPTRHVTLSLIYQTLYCCGLRISEVLNLTIDKIDFENGILLLKGTKDYRDRIIPLPKKLLQKYCSYYSQIYQSSKDNTYFFKSDYGKPYSLGAVAVNFRRILWECGISYGGRLKGPSLHCLRHTFSVHCLQKAMSEGKELKDFLPVLSTFLGHKTLHGTQMYLHLTAELYPDILSKLNEYCSNIIPEVGDIHE